MALLAVDFRIISIAFFVAFLSSNFRLLDKKAIRGILKQQHE